MTIAPAVEQQTAATNEMTATSTEATLGADIASNISGAANATQTTARHTDDSRRAATTWPTFPSNCAH